MYYDDNINYSWLKKMVKDTFKKYCGVNSVIFKVCLTKTAKHKIWYLWNAKKAVLRFCMMNNKKRISILLKIIDQIQNDNEDARSDIEKSVATIFKEEGISFEQAFYILFLML